MQGVIEKVAILILDSCGCVVERYIISLRVSLQEGFRIRVEGQFSVTLLILPSLVVVHRGREGLLKRRHAAGAT